MENTDISLGTYLAILKRRFWSLLLPFLLVTTLSAVVALLLPSIYRAESTILIEEQEIPADFVTATVTGYAEQRLQSIKQRIMSSTRLLEIINRFALYQDLREKRTTEEIVDQMREDIELTTISAEVLDRRTGRPSTATIAFTLSYQGKDPQQVQQVASVLASLYLEENLKVRERQTQETSSFLEDEMNKVRTELDTVESTLAIFKEKHLNELPEMLAVNRQGLDNAERTIERDMIQMQSLKERASYLESQLAALPEQEQTPDLVRLEALKTQLIALRTRFSDEHPDVINTRREIDELERRFSSGEAREEAKSSPKSQVHITLASQLAATRLDIAGMQSRIEESKQQAEAIRRRVEATPRIENEYVNLVMQKTNLQGKFSDLMKKLMEARVAHGLEKEQKGERFSLIDPARLPEKPFKPNRLAIVLIGIVLGAGAGVGFGALREMADSSVRSPEMLSRLSGFPVLASLPEIVTTEDRRSQLRRKIIWVVAIVAAAATAVAIFHFFVMDLDIFWAKLTRMIDRKVPW